MVERNEFGKKKTGGGKYNGIIPPVYFFAANDSFTRVADRILEMDEIYTLIATNELKSVEDAHDLTVLIDRGCNVFLDSGIFNLTMNHVRTTGVSMDEALALNPTEITGFSELFEKYVGIANRYENDLWGYVELDQGGRENKIITRTRLEEEYNLCPIPVFHPLNDGWDYLDFLLENYDRICVGNLVQASPNLRYKLLYEIRRRWQSHKDVWIHALGVGPHAISNFGMVTSCDSSSWCGEVRWGRVQALAHDRVDTEICDYLSIPLGINMEQRGKQITGLIDKYMVYNENRSAYLSEITEDNL